MGSAEISVVIPVGPYSFYKDFTKEAVQSVREQTVQPTEILLIDDMAGIGQSDYPDCNIWRAPWNLGVPCAANIGVSLAKNENVLFLACDDKLFPNAVECLQKQYLKTKDPLGYYWLDLEYSTGERQALPAGHAMVSKTLWRETGGFPVQSAIGACDHIFVNMLMIKFPGHIHHVEGGILYWNRDHPGRDGRNRTVDYSVIESVRDSFVKVWKKPEWGRYS